MCWSRKTRLLSVAFLAACTGSVTASPPTLSLSFGAEVEEEDVSVVKPTSYKISQARRVHRNVALTEAHQQALDDQKGVKTAWVTTTQVFLGAFFYQAGTWHLTGDFDTVSRVLDGISGQFIIQIAILRSKFSPNAVAAGGLWTQRQSTVGGGTSGYRWEVSAGADATYAYYYLHLLDAAGTMISVPAAPADLLYTSLLLVARE